MSKRQYLLPAYAIAWLIPAAAVSAQSVGVASWYGAKHEGRRTSSGEVFEQEGMTAASRDIPLGTRIRVTLHETGQSVVVRVNDRMGSRSAVIDLSRGAAREIGLLGRGRGTVSIEPAEGEPVEVADAGPADDQGDAPQHRRAFQRAGRHGASLIMARRTAPHRSARHRL